MRRARIGAASVLVTIPGRVIRAHEALVDGELDLALALLDDLVSEIPSMEEVVRTVAASDESERPSGP